MDVGNDPFPREEVTGLAAFEDLEPVGSMSVLPPEPDPEPPPPPARTGRPQPTVHGYEPAQVANPFAHPNAAAQRERADATMPLDLSAETAAFREDLAPLESQGSGRHGADHLFDTSGEGDSDGEAPGWAGTDAATSVGTQHDARAQSAALDMDWDEDEPPTRMRGDGMLDMPPMSLPIDWDEANSATQIYTSGSASALLPSAIPSNTTLTGGRPSPFPPAPKPLAARTESLGAPSPFASTAVGTENWMDSLKSGDRRAWTWAGAGAVGLIALALLLRAFASGSSSGVVTITTAPSDARVLVDGRLAASSSSPYSLSDLSAGKHELLVQKSGFVDYHANFTLSRGEQKTLPPVELVASVREVGFSIRSAPPGAEVWIDGRATDQLTPAKFADVTPGAHRLQLKRPGYADYELQMIVPDATLLQLTADLVPTINSAAPPPTAAVREKPVRAEVETSLAAVARDAERPARATHTKTSSSAFAASPSPTRMATPTPAISAAVPAAGGRGGTLRVNSRPWATIFVDGRPVGNTPQPNLQLSPGSHKIQLVNQPMGLSKAFSVNVKPGDVITKVMNLAE